MPKPGSMYRKVLADTVGRTAIDAMPAALIRVTYLGVHRRGYGTTVSSYLREMFRGIESEPPRYVLSDVELGSMKPPVAVIMGRGEADEAAAKRVTSIPNGRFDTVPGDHEPWFDDLAACATCVSQFLSAA